MNESKPLTRREFFKLGLSGIAAEVARRLGATGIKKTFEYFFPEPARVLDQTERLVNIYKDAWLSGKKEVVEEAELLIGCWLMANTAIVVGKDQGLTTASFMMEHYLQASGDGVNMTTLVQEYFSPALFSEGSNKSSEVPANLIDNTMITSLVASLVYQKLIEQHREDPPSGIKIAKLDSTDAFDFAQYGLKYGGAETYLFARPKVSSDQIYALVKDALGFNNINGLYKIWGSGRNDNLGYDINMALGVATYSLAVNKEALQSDGAIVVERDENNFWVTINPIVFSELLVKDTYDFGGRQTVLPVRVRDVRKAATTIVANYVTNEKNRELLLEVFERSLERAIGKVDQIGLVDNVFGEGYDEYLEVPHDAFETLEKHGFAKAFGVQANIRLQDGLNYYEDKPITFKIYIQQQKEESDN